MGYPQLVAINGLNLSVPSRQGFLQREIDGAYNIVAIAFEQRVGFLYKAVS
jgi:hypothetical protein